MPAFFALREITAFLSSDTASQLFLLLAFDLRNIRLNKYRRVTPCFMPLRLSRVRDNSTECWNSRQRDKIGIVSLHVHTCARACIRVSGKSGDFHITLSPMYRQKYSGRIPRRASVLPFFFASLSKYAKRSYDGFVLSLRTFCRCYASDTIPFCMQSTRNVINNLQISLT